MLKLYELLEVLRSLLVMTVMAREVVEESRAVCRTTPSLYNPHTKDNRLLACRCRTYLLFLGPHVLDLIIIKNHSGTFFP